MMIDSLFIYDKDQIEPTMTLHGIIDVAVDCYTDIVTLSAREAIVTDRFRFTLPNTYTALAVGAEMAVMLDVRGVVNLVRQIEEPWTSDDLFGWRVIERSMVVELELRLTNKAMVNLMGQESWRQFDMDLFKMLVDKMEMTHRDAIKAAFMEDVYGDE